MEPADYRGRRDEAIGGIGMEPFVPELRGPDSDLIVHRKDVQTVDSQLVA